MNPDAEEVCNSVDDDCDGDTDEDVTLTFYRDSDNDGYGDPAATDIGCTAPSGYVDNDEDCHDSDATLNPDTVWTIDYDGDGYGDADQSYTQSQCTQPTGYVRDISDCDDADSDINPDGTEVCDGADNDCDGTSDNDDATDASTWYDDTDGDGYGDPDTTTTACEQPSGYLTDATDCEPSEATAYPGSTAIEVPNDSIDQNCDGNDGCADLDCDNIADLVLVEHYDGNYEATVWVYFNDGSGTFSDSDRTGVTAYGAYDAEAGDVNGDGYQDIVVANYYNGSTRDINSYVYYGSASGYSDTDRDDLPTHGALSTQVQDLNGDGYADAVFGAWYSNSTGYSTDAYVYYGSATGMNSGDRDTLPASGNRETETADFDGDGYTDIVLCNQRTSSTFNTKSTIYWGSSSGYSSGDTSSLPTRGCRDVDAGDLDGDGYDDIVFANYRNNGGDYSIDSYLYYGSSTGFSTTNREELATTGTLSAALGDFDGDGTTDVAFGGYYGGSWSSTAQTVVYWNSSSGFLTSNKTSVGTRGVREVYARDIDGDGIDDLVGPTYYTGSGYNGNSYLWWGSTTGISDTDRDSLPSSGAGHIASEDLDGDGFEEVVFSNYYNGSSYGVGTYIYYGPETSLGSTNRDTLSTTGVWGRPLFVGP